jgi:hypothetical protein
MNMRQEWIAKLALCAAAALIAGCGDDADPPENDAGSRDDGGPGDGGGSCQPRAAGEIPQSVCKPRADDYAPCTDDGYAECVSDDGEYHRIEESISTIGRVEAFEQIADLLFDPETDAASDAFLQARMIYQTDEGLDSRVVRRFDPHFEVPDGTDCTLPDVPAEYPDYCVGPARLQPTLLDAFNRGIMEDAPREQAARIEAALLWFLYASTAKESLTCTEVARDCDSAYAYYTGGEDARGGIGFARYVAEVDSYAHDRAWDGLLAVRCWRDLDDAELATDEDLRERARAQYDSALIHGLAMVLRDRLEKLAASTGEEQRYYFAFVTTLGPALQREAELRSSDDAAALADELAEDDPADIDTAAAIEAIDALFDCA